MFIRSLCTLLKKSLDPLYAFAERPSISIQPLLQLIRMPAHLLAKLLQIEAVDLLVPREPTNSVVRTIERNVP